MKNVTRLQPEVSVLATDLAFPEGPVFNAQDELWFVELQGGNVVRWHQDKLERFPTGGSPNGLVVDSSGNLCVCDSGLNAVLHFSATTEFQHMITHVEGTVLNKPNDLIFDNRGNLIFTCPGDSRQDPSGYVCCWTPSGATKKIMRGMYFPNGLALGNDGETLVIAETYKHRLWKGIWNADRLSWEDAKPWVEVGGPIGPDGMAFHEDGKLYVAVYGSGTVKVINTHGTIEAEIGIPGSNPTNLAFDPSGVLGLVVTETERGQLLSLAV